MRKTLSLANVRTLEGKNGLYIYTRDKFGYWKRETDKEKLAAFFKLIDEQKDRPLVETKKAKQYFVPSKLMPF